MQVHKGRDVSQIWWFSAPFPNFPSFPNFPFFPSFPFIISFFPGVFEFPHFTSFAWAHFRGNCPPAQGLFFYPSSPPKPKATHPRQSNAVENATIQAINADTDVLCVSTEAKGRSSQRTEALRATQHAGQAWMAIKGFDLVCTHKPDASRRSMTGVCASCRRWRPVLEGGNQLDKE